MEIWRSSWSPGNDDIPQPTTNSPNQIMYRAYGEAARRHPFTHGRFHPWAHIQCSVPTWAFRLVFPTLVTGGYNRYFLYDVPSAQLIQTIHDTANSVQEGWVNYLEINEKYVFASRPSGIRVFSR